MTSPLLLGILLAVGFSVQAKPNYNQMEKQKALLDALRFVENAMQEQEDSDESLFEEDLQKDPYYGNNYEKYIQENWPEMAPEINLQPGPPIEEPPFNSLDNWQSVEEDEQFPIGQGYPIVESESEDINGELMEEELESVEESVLLGEEVSQYDIDGEMLEKMIQEAIREGTLVTNEIEEEEESELESQTSEDEEFGDIYGVDDEEEEITEEEEEMLDQFTKDLIEEVREEVAKEVQKIADDAVRDLADEITAEVVEELENGDIEFSDVEMAFGDDDEAEASDYDLDEDDFFPEYGIDSAESAVEEEQPVKRDGEYAFGSWEDIANADKDANEVDEGVVMDESTNEDDMDDLTWEALQYLYGPYLDNLKEGMMKFDDDEDIGNDIDSDFELEDSEQQGDMPGDSYFEDVQGDSEDDPDYDYSQSVDEEPPYEAMYEEAMVEAVKDIEDEAADAARELVDEMLLELVEEEQRKEEIEEERQEQIEEEEQKEQLMKLYAQSDECEMLAYVMDDCDVIDSYEGLGDNGYKEAFRRPCNRHQLCYMCGATYQLTESVCDEVFYNEMESMCEDGSVCRLKAGYFLKAAQQSRESPEINPYVDFICRNRCVVDALYE